LTEPGKYWFCQEVIGLNQEDFGLDQEDHVLDHEVFGLDQEVLASNYCYCLNDVDVCLVLIKLNANLL
jgi:hypothetical protein